MGRRRTRNGNAFTSKFAGIATAVSKINLSSVPSTVTSAKVEASAKEDSLPPVSKYARLTADAEVESCLTVYL